MVTSGTMERMLTLVVAEDTAARSRSQPAVGEVRAMQFCWLSIGKNMSKPIVADTLNPQPMRYEIPCGS